MPQDVQLTHSGGWKLLLDISFALKTLVVLATIQLVGLFLVLVVLVYRMAYYDNIHTQDDLLKSTQPSVERTNR